MFLILGRHHPAFRVRVQVVVCCNGLALLRRRKFDGVGDAWANAEREKKLSAKPRDASRFITTS
jgi:hypothetical protein